MTLVILDQLADSLNIAGPLNKGCSHIVQIILYAKDNILFILLRNRWQADSNTRSSYTLLGAHRATVQNLSNNILALDFLYLQTNQAIRQQNGIAWLYFLVQLLVADRCLMLITWGISIGQNELLTLGKLNLAILELTQTHLRAFGIQQQSYNLVSMTSSISYHFNTAHMLSMITMREIKTGTVHTCINQAFNHAWFLSSWSHSTYNFSFL